MEKTKYGLSGVTLVVVFVLTLPLLSIGILAGLLFQIVRAGFMIGRQGMELVYPEPQS